MNNFNMTPVQSSQIAEIGHNPETSTLRVKFLRGGKTYEYANVSPELHQKLMSASSVGSFFSAEIKKNPSTYPCTAL